MDLYARQVVAATVDMTLTLLLAPMERLFRTVKSEWVPKRRYASLDQAIKDIRDYLIRTEVPLPQQWFRREKEAKKLSSNS